MVKYHLLKWPLKCFDKNTILLIHYYNNYIMIDERDLNPMINMIQTLPTYLAIKYGWECGCLELLKQIKQLFRT